MKHVCGESAGDEDVDQPGKEETGNMATILERTKDEHIKGCLETTNELRKEIAELRKDEAADCTL